MSFGPSVTPPVIQHLIIANIVAFFVQHLLLPGQIAGDLAIRPAYVWQGGFLWQPFTYMWLHGGLGHILMNMFMLWMFGSQLALAWGPRKFLRFYLICGIGAGFIIATWPYLIMNLRPESVLIPTIGASGAIYGVLLAYSLTWPDRTIMLLFPPIPIKAIYFIPFILVMGWLFGAGNVSHVGHLGGVLVGWILLRRMGTTGGITFKSLQYRWRRYRMRRKLRAVRREEFRSRRRSDDDHRTFH